MALTRSDWTEKSVNDRLVLTCTVAYETDDRNVNTVKTPKSLDPTKPWTLHVNTAGVTIDGSAVPVDIYSGYADNFSVTGDQTITVVSGGMAYADCIDDVKSTRESFTVLPNLAAARVQGTVAGVSGYGDVGVAPYYAFDLDGSTDFSTGLTVTFVIVQ